MARKWRFMSFKTADSTIRISYMKKETKGPLGYIGKAESALFGEISLVIDRRPEIDRQYDLACSLNVPGRSWVVMDRTVFYGFLQGSPLSRMTVFHEIGHSNYKDQSNKNETEARKSHVLEGQVSEKELKADRFAADFLGTDVTIQGLEALIDDMAEKFTEDYDLSDIEIAKQEILLRIKALQQAEE